MRDFIRNTGLPSIVSAVVLFAVIIVFALLQPSCNGNRGGSKGQIVPAGTPSAVEKTASNSRSAETKNGKNLSRTAPSLEQALRDSMTVILGPAGPSIIPYIKPRDGKLIPPNLSEDQIVRIYLSFDDGPHAAPAGTGANYTENIMRTLAKNSVQDGIKALFCVQTHVANRGEHPNGRQIISMLHNEGHVVAIHTGSTQDHVNHKVRATYPAYDCNDDGEIDVADGENALESDMLRAIERIEEITGEAPKFVRPTYGSYNDTTKEVYERHALRMIMWDVDSGDALGRQSPGTGIASSLKRKVTAHVLRGNTEVLVLFHDIKAGTQEYLDDYIIAIYEGVQAAGKFAIFASTRKEVEDFLLRY